MKQRSELIDFLKGLAMIGVIVVHFNSYYQSPSYIMSLVAEIGSRCPQLFFIISAFLTWNSLSKNNNVDILRFWRSRFIKIAPLYYLSLFIACMIPVIRIGEIDGIDALTHAVFLNGLFPSYTNSIMGVEWYIADLALFYFLVPLLFKFAHSLKTSLVVFVLSLIINVIFTVVTNNVFANEIASIRSYEMYFHTFCIINQLPVIMLGALIYYLHDYTTKKDVQINKILGGSCVIVFLFLMAFIVFGLNKRYVTSSFVAALLFAWCTMVLLSKYPNLNGWGILSKIGQKSFGIYCVHIIVIKCVVLLPFIAEYNNTYMWLILLALTIVASYFVGTMMENVTNKIIKYI